MWTTGKAKKERQSKTTTPGVHSNVLGFQGTFTKERRTLDASGPVLSTILENRLFLLRSKL